MVLSNAHSMPEAGPSDLKGLRVLVVEDSWHVGTATKRLLQALGADVVGPVATAADAVRLISEHAPDVAVVDINLRDGERAHGLIDRLHAQGIRVVVTSGYDRSSAGTGKGRGHPAEARQPGAASSRACAQLLQTRQQLCNEISRVIVGHPRPRGNSILQHAPSDASTRSTVPPSS